MATEAPAIAGEMEVLRYQSRLIQQVLRINTEGVTHEESLRRPEPAGNCLNWVVGHLVWVYCNVLRELGQEPPLPAQELARYARGAAPLTDAGEARDLGELLAAWDVASERVRAGLAGVSPEALDQPAPNSPTGNPDETIRTLLSTVLFHQGYHVGQTGVLRRLLGKPGAIK
ncbi:MAG TPA: DinB family protein [Longimicrobium sp.]|nr:DinB family protein [Longimicrobium sp.]